MRVVIWQTDQGWRFFEYGQALDLGLDPENYLSGYESVWDGELPDDTSLEDIFVLFNIGMPEGYRGRSLSVSDIVQVGGELYYCDSIGFNKLKV